MLSSDQVVTAQLFINGEVRPASQSATYDVFDPARPNEIVGRAAAASPGDVDEAVKAANSAYPAWSRLTHSERGVFLRKIAEAITADNEDIDYRARLLTRENGKISRESRMEMLLLGRRFTEAADYGARIAVDEKLQGPPFDTIVCRQAVGVAALIIPWNSPLSILGAKLPQALITGNTAVVKVSEFAGLAATLTLKKIAEMLPPGVLNVLSGDGAVIGDALTGHPMVRRVNFTGSVRVGKLVMRSAAQNLTPVTLEMGGNDAALVLDDAELDNEAFDKMYWGAFATSGQICMAIKRLYVHENRYDEVVDGLTMACERAVVGDGLLPATTMGPVNNVRQYDNIRKIIAQAKTRGADIRECGQVPDQELYQTGYFQRPTLVFDADHDLSIVNDEQFGPALPIMKFASDVQAVELANNCDLGLGSSVWTTDPERALQVARKIEAGCTYLNGHGPKAQDARGPFGGVKQSGIGRNLGYEGVLQFTDAHSIVGPAGFLMDE